MELEWDEMDKLRHHQFLNEEKVEYEMTKKFSYLLNHLVQSFNYYQITSCHPTYLKELQVLSSVLHICEENDDALEHWYP